MKYLTTTPQLPIGVGARTTICDRPGKTTSLRNLLCLLLSALLTTGVSCRNAPGPRPSAQVQIEPFGFQITSGEDHYQIEGYYAYTNERGRMPALLVLNGDGGDSLRCINHVRRFTMLHIRLACISLPGYGKSSGPSRFVGAQSVEAARRGLDLVAARADVDPDRLALWGIADGAVAAGLLMDSDQRAHAVILQSGAYDLVKLWPGAPIGTKLSILRQVWPSKRLLEERSVIQNLPPKLDCSVLILHGERDRKMPVKQAEQLAQALRARGAHVETRFFADGSHRLGQEVDAPLSDFLRAHLAAPPPSNAS